MYVLLTYGHREDEQVIKDKVIYGSETGAGVCQSEGDYLCGIAHE